MRHAALLIVVCLLASPQVLAGTLSRARGAARNAERNNDDDRDRNNGQRDSGKLDHARDEVRHEPPRERDDDRRGSHRRRRRGHSHGGRVFGIFAFDRCQPCCPPPVVETYVYPAEPLPVAPYVVEPYVDPLPITPAETFTRQFTPYPYANDSEGFMLTGSPGCGQPWLGRVHFELGSDFDGIDRTGAGFLLEGEGGLGIDFDWDSYSEDLPGGGHDELHIGEFDVLYRIAETDHALVRVGLGAAWLGDRYDTDFGVNFTLKADLAPSEPIVLSGELDLGTLGDAQHVHASGTVGVMLNRCEVFGGYDYRRIGDVEIEGPMVGIRVWF